MHAKPLNGNKQWVRDYNWLKQLAAMNINHSEMTTRLTAVLAAILLAGGGKPQPPTVEKAAKPVPKTPVHLAPEPVEPAVKVARPELPVDKPTAKLKLRRFHFGRLPERETLKRSSCIWLVTSMQIPRMKVDGHPCMVHLVQAKRKSLNFFWQTGRM